MSTQKYEFPITIRFGHCDPAGIVYHPQYIVMVNQVMEAFAVDVLKETFSSMVTKDHWMPVVGIHCEFASPSKPGDECLAQMWVEHIGNRSVRFACTITCKEELRLQIVETVVFTKHVDGKMIPTEIPAYIREALQTYLVDGQTVLPMKFRS